MTRAIRLLSLIALACAALAIWFAIRSLQLALDAVSSSSLPGAVEYLLSLALALSVTALVLSLIILGVIATLRRGQWRWLAAITMGALGTGAILYELGRETCFIISFSNCKSSGFLTSAVEALVPRVTKLDFTEPVSRAIIYWSALALPLLILLLTYSLAAERAGPSADRQGPRGFIAIGFVALALALIFGADQLFLRELRPITGGDEVLLLTIQPLMAVFTIVVAGSAGFSALRNRQWPWSAALLLVTSVGAIMQLGILVGLINPPVAYEYRPYYFWYALILGLLMISLPVTTLMYAFTGDHKARSDGVHAAAQT